MRSREELVARSWAIALGHYLADYDEQAPYETVLEGLESGSQDVTVWEPFEGHDPLWVVQQIETMQEYIFGELLWAQGVDA